MPFSIDLVSMHYNVTTALVVVVAVVVVAVVVVAVVVADVVVTTMQSNSFRSLQ